MPNHTVIWTVLPNGIRPGSGGTRPKLVFSVHVSPRLRTDQADGKLADFDDWLNWPTTLAGITFGLSVPGLGTFGATPLPRYDAARWTDLFPEDTLVRRYEFQRYDHLKIHSYPHAHVLKFLVDQYGKFGATSPDEPPTYDELMEPEAFGPIGFEDEHVDTGQDSGPTRRRMLRRELVDSFDTKADDPDQWALPFDPNGDQDAADIGKNFLQAQSFLRRDLPQGEVEPEPLEQPELDFHEIVSLTRDYPALTRLLGLVLDFEVDLPVSVVPELSTTAQLRVDWTPKLGEPSKVIVTPTTRTDVGPDTFEATPKPDSDLAGRQLRVGADAEFGVVPVDLDGAAINAMQFADNVSRSQIKITLQKKNKRNAYTSERFALPALSTGGLAVGKKGQANHLAKKVLHLATMNAATFDDDSGEATGTPPDFYLDDLVRGFRWDVLDVEENVWRSLMKRSGSFTFTASGTTVAVEDDEAATVTAVTTSGAPKENEDRYLQETLMHWSGWSLAVPRPGMALGLDEKASDDGNTEGEVPFDSTFALRPGSLPRLRFGRSYRFRARAVDLAGNSLPASEGDLSNGDAYLVSDRIVFRRFEPIEPPAFLLRKPGGKADVGASEAHLVVRSENKADQTAAHTERHVVPPRASVLLPEWHGAYDLANGLVDASAALRNELADRDAARLEDQGHLDGAGSYYFDEDEVVVSFTPCVRAPHALVRGLPGNGETVLEFADAQHAWPNFRSLRLRLATGDTAGWKPSADVLDVVLAKGDIVELRVSSRFDAEHLGEFGVWNWIARWASEHGQNVDALRTKAIEGRHWMLTPPRPVKLVHAVRTPLLDPDFLEQSPTPTKEAIGDTFAKFRRNWIAVSRKSTSKLDVIGSWTMKVDRGPNTPATLPVVVGSADDPLMDRAFSATAFTLPVSRSPQPSVPPDQIVFDAKQEFGDTKYRKVTYDCVATSSFTEYFRTELHPDPVLTDEDAVPIPVPFEPTTVKVLDLATGRAYQPARNEAAELNPPEGDYVLHDGQLRRTRHSKIPTGAAVRFSYVAPEIHTHAAPEVREVVSSARPAAPNVLYVVPAFAWSTAPGQSTREGGYLRVYLDRPWWSSGDGEQLGVVLWKGAGNAKEPDERIGPFVTQWGIDPAHVSAYVPNRPTPSSFPLGTPASPGAPLTLAELGDAVASAVDVVGHDVGFDYERGLWYADLRVTRLNNQEHASYFPFVRLALARYQPKSMANCHLSKVVVADFVQLAPDRTVSLTASTIGPATQVTLRGRSYASSGGRASGTSRSDRSRARAYVEVADPGIPDENLRWRRPAGSLDANLTVGTVQDGNLVTWSGLVLIPPGSGAKRMVIEEYEVHYRGSELLGPTGERVVHRDIVPL